MSSFSARVGLAAGAGIVALIVLATTLWFLGEALTRLFQAKGIGPAGAAGLTGLVGIIVTALLLLLAKLAMRSPRRRPTLPVATTAPGSSGVANGIAADLGALAAQQIINTTREHPYGTMGAALAAGLAVGAIPELRKSVFGLFKH